jgi:multimeric flavodoxin WrbA
MKVVGINGSPRKNWNTAQMLESALAGSRDAGAETKLYHLYDMDFKGCSSCFACKRLGGPSYGKCGMRDALTEILDEIWESDALIIGSPVYFSDVTACMRAFLERLWFAGLAYNMNRMVLNEKRIPVKIILTTNAPMAGFHKALNEGLINTMNTFIGLPELIEANDTLQFDDYSKYDAVMINEEAKIKRHKEVFPFDLKRAYEMGKNAVNEAAII